MSPPLPQGSSGLTDEVCAPAIREAFHVRCKGHIHGIGEGYEGLRVVPAAPRVPYLHPKDMRLNHLQPEE